MDSESKKLLEDTFALAKDNNKILHYIRRSMHLQHFLSFVYWLLIIGSMFATYYFAQPYIAKFMDIYTRASNELNTIKQLKP